MPTCRKAAQPVACAAVRIGYAAHDGWVAEWFKAPVLKTGEVQASVGSNPTPSANRVGRPVAYFRFMDERCSALARTSGESGYMC